MRMTLWLAWKLWWTRKTFFGGSAALSLFGLVLGVACLVASMAVMSGFENTLRSAMADVSGHVTVIQRSRSQSPWEETESKIKSVEPSLVSSMRFTYSEGIVAREGQVLGVVIQGLDQDRVKQVLRLEDRLRSGEMRFQKDQQASGALIGLGVAQRLGLSVGDKFKVVVPISHEMDPQQFKRQVGEFIVRGILDLGKHDWNQRFIITDIETSQKLAQVDSSKYTGLLLRFSNLDYARTAAFNLSDKLGSGFYVRDWRDVNENLFEAVKYERVVIFFVVLVIVIVSAFNVSSTLFVNVVRRYSDIAILKSLGLPSAQILRIYSLQGLIIGTFGLFFGILLGFILCGLFSFYQTRLGLISGDVYKIDSIHIDIRMIDLLAVSIATLMICFLATYAPARRGAQLDPVEGLRYG